MTDPTYIILFA